MPTNVMFYLIFLAFGSVFLVLDYFEQKEETEFEKLMERFDKCIEQFERRKVNGPATKNNCKNW